MNKKIDELYKEIYKLSKEKGLTVPLIFKPCNSIKCNADNVWGVMIENQSRETQFVGYGKSQEEALTNLKSKLLE